MKNLWKALGLTAIIAAIPVRSSTNEVTGERTYETLLSKVTVRPKKEGKGTDIRVDLLGGLIPESLRVDSEYDDYDDDAIFADELDDFADESPKETVFEVSMKVERDLSAESEDTVDEAKEIVEETEAFAGEAEPELI